MIPYKLAKELKDAGFPLIEMVDEHPSYSNCIRCGHPYVIIDGKNYLEPNLNILIDACEEHNGTILLMGSAGEWKAIKITDRGGMIESIGLDKEEAVAKLWLKLKVGKQ